MRVRHDSATCGTGAVRWSILHVSRIPRQSMYQPNRAQTLHSLAHLTCNAKQLKQQANLRIKSDLQIKHYKSMTSPAYKRQGSGKNSGRGMRVAASHTASYIIPDEH